MTQHSSDTKRRALAFAEELASMAREAPDADTKSKVYAAVAAIRRQNGFTLQEKREEIMHYVQLGASTIDDLENETHLSRRDICDLVAGLERERKIRTRKYSEGNRGRPKLLIIAIEPENLNYSPPKN